MSKCSDTWFSEASSGAQGFTRRLFAQLLRNHKIGVDKLHIRGKAGFLLKATLLSYGYTVVVKATNTDHVS
jgi:hypothetical protein